MYDNWTQCGALYFHLPVCYSSEFMEKDIEELVEKGKRKEEKLRWYFPSELVEHVLSKIDIGVMDGGKDSPVGMLTSFDNFSVRSSWEALRILGSPNGDFDKIWSKGVHFKVSFFVRRMFKKKDPYWRILLESLMKFLLLL